MREIVETGGAQVVGLDAVIGVVHLRIFAFSDSATSGIFQAIELALETVGHQRDPGIESAYPLMSANGEFTSVRVVAMP